MADYINKAYFAGGCFWGIENHFEHVEGVVSTASGYMGGKKEEPTYREVCSGKTGHAETVEVVYDTRRVSFMELAKLFFEIHDPTQTDRQGPDEGTQYRSVIFHTSPEQKKIAAGLITELKSHGIEVVTKLEKSGTFWKAEEYHQKYFSKKGIGAQCHARIPRPWK